MQKPIVPILAFLAAATACNQPSTSMSVERVTGRGARLSFGDTVAAMLLDTTLYELRAHLFVKIQNPNTGDESPLADQELPHPSRPGPHTLNGRLYAELTVLQNLLGPTPAVRVDTSRDHVFIGNPPVLLVAHRHGDDVYVPVKLFARQFGAYTDVRCTLANCGYIWPSEIIALMTKKGFTGGAGILEGFAEGIVRNIDVTRLPGG